jgi:DNA-binding FadR family transcriptional regulator
MLESLSGRTHRARIWRGLSEESAVQRTLAEHRSILAGLADRQPDVAQAWARVHVAGVESWLRRVLVDEHHPA